MCTFWNATRTFSQKSTTFFLILQPAQWKKESQDWATMPSIPSFRSCRQQSLRSSFSHAFASLLHGPLVEVTWCATNEKLWVKFCVCSVLFMFTIASDASKGCCVHIGSFKIWSYDTKTLRLLGTVAFGLLILDDIVPDPGPHIVT